MGDKSKSGPSAYSGRQLPSPKNIISRIASPFKPHEAVFILGCIGCIFGVGLSYITNTGYHSISLYSLSFGVLFGVVLSSLNIGSSLQNKTPSINSVSNTTNYATIASRLALLTTGGVLLTMIVITITHVSDMFYVIDPSTRFAVTLMIILSSFFSLIVVITICSNSALLDVDIIKEIVGISSIPEIISIGGFVIAPIVVLATGVIYNGPPLVDIPFSFSFIDSYLILHLTIVLYISISSRLG